MATIKKIILLALIALIMVGCNEEHINRYTEEQIDLFDFDSYEYLRTQGAYAEINLTHKGNCRFCKERRKKEIKELLELLKKE